VARVAAVASLAIALCSVAPALGAPLADTQTLTVRANTLTPTRSAALDPAHRYRITVSGTVGVHQGVANEKDALYCVAGVSGCPAPPSPANYFAVLWLNASFDATGTPTNGVGIDDFAGVPHLPYAASHTYAVEFTGKSGPIAFVVRVAPSGLSSMSGAWTVIIEDLTSAPAPTAGTAAPAVVASATRVPTATSAPALGAPTTAPTGGPTSPPPRPSVSASPAALTLANPGEPGLRIVKLTPGVTTRAPGGQTATLAGASFDPAPGTKLVVPVALAGSSVDPAVVFQTPGWGQFAAYPGTTVTFDRTGFSAPVPDVRLTVTQGSVSIALEKPASSGATTIVATPQAEANVTGASAVVTVDPATSRTSVYAVEGAVTVRGSADSAPVALAADQRSTVAASGRATAPAAFTAKDLPITPLLKVASSSISVPIPALIAALALIGGAFFVLLRRRPAAVPAPVGTAAVARVAPPVSTAPPPAYAASRAVPPAPPPASIAPKLLAFCTTCGMKAVPGEGFCHKCGASLVDSR